MLDRVTQIRILLLVLALPGLGLVVMAQSTSEVQRAFEAATNKMMQAMMVKPSGDADSDFAMMMISHHEGAIDMAKLELQYGKDLQLRAMAEKIIAAQEVEIAKLKKWQQEPGM
jgi:uncharacterized protein (DUF305 family)